MSVLTSLDQKLAQLKLGRLRTVVASWITQAEQQQLGYAEFLDELLAEEVLSRQENQIRRKLKAAAFRMRPHWNSSTFRCARNSSAQ